MTVFLKVIGPLLILIYVDDTADSILFITRLFADDRCLDVPTDDISTIED
jgi:hypothetical protein